MARNLTAKERAKRNLEAAKNKKPIYIKQGVNGEKITGKKRWG